jgi:hypothetical protein
MRRAVLIHVEINNGQNQKLQSDFNKLFDTVASKKSRYTNEDYSQAVLAHQLQIRVGRPSTKDFLRIVACNQLPNCPITRDDILTAEDIFGPDISSLKGKMAQRKPH